MTRDARLSALHRGGFGLRAALLSPALAPDRFQRAPRIQVVMPGRRVPSLPERAVTSRRRRTPRLAPPSGSSREHALNEQGCASSSITSKCSQVKNAFSVRRSNLAIRVRREPAPSALPGRKPKSVIADRCVDERGDGFRCAHNPCYASIARCLPLSGISGIGDLAVGDVDEKGGSVRCVAIGAFAPAAAVCARHGAARCKKPLCRRPARDCR
jgi:hypothetical protein